VGIKSWHVGKVVILWILNLVLFLLFYDESLSIGYHYYLELKYVVFILLSLPTLCITWIWLTGLENRK
jgi:hypothetical protein